MSYGALRCADLQVLPTWMQPRKLGSFSPARHLNMNCTCRQQGMTRQRFGLCRKASRHWTLQAPSGTFNSGAALVCFCIAALQRTELELLKGAEASSNLTPST